LASDADLISGVRLLKDPRNGFEFLQSGWMSSWRYYLLDRPIFPQDATFFSEFVRKQAMPLDERLHYGFDVAFFYKALSICRKVILSDAIISQMHIYASQKSHRLEDYNIKRAESETLMREYSPRNHRIYSYLLGTKLHGFLVWLSPLVYRHKRQKFLKMELNVVTGRWNLVKI